MYYFEALQDMYSRCLLKLLFSIHGKGLLQWNVFIIGILKKTEIIILYITSKQIILKEFHGNLDIPDCSVILTKMFCIFIKRDISNVNAELENFKDALPSYI